MKQTGCMISVTYRTAVRSTISLPSDWKRQQEQHAVFTMICFLCAFISLSEDKLLHLEENKKETKKWFNALGRSTPFGGTKFGLTRSISNVSENVKPLLVSLKAYSEAEKKDHAKSAKEFFGETNNRNENGYITTDCTKLDFSDHHEGAPGEHRYVDHRDTRGEAAVQVELERYYGGAKALLAQNEAFLKGITEALLLTLHHTRRGEQARRVWTDFNPRPPRGGRQRPSTTAMRPLEFQSTPPARGGDYGKDFAELEAVAQKWQEAFDAAEQRVIMKTESTFTEGTEYERKGRAGKEAYGRGEGEGRTTGRGEDQTVRGEFSPSSERYGEVSADFGEKPYRAWVNGNTVTPAPGTVSYDAQISIHAPREGGDHSGLASAGAPSKFQSTPPARGATHPNDIGVQLRIFQSTPPARGAT